MTADEFIRTKCRDDGNIFPDGTTGQEGLDLLIRHLLGDDYYVVDALPTNQANTVAIRDILENYPRKKRWWNIF